MDLKNYPLDTVFIFEPEDLVNLNIPILKPIDLHIEEWKFVHLDKDDCDEYRRFLVSSYGRVFDILNNRLVPQYSVVKSQNGYYKQVLIYHNSMHNHNYFVHRLVALAFIPKTDEDIRLKRNIVNHKDGFPPHNYAWNLEWCTVSENSIHAVNTGLINQPKGEKRSNALWSDEEVHLICSLMEDGHKATYIYNILCDIIKDPKVQYERVRSLYKHIIHRTHWTHISSQYDIDFSGSNYAKEKGNVKKQMSRRKMIFIGYD